MRLLYISTGVTNSGGVSRVLSLKANAFADALGYEVHIFSTNDDSQITFFSFSEKVKIHFSKYKNIGLHNIFGFRKEVRELNKALNPDAIFITDNGLKSFLIYDCLYPKAIKMYEIHSSTDAFLNQAYYSGIKNKIYQWLIRHQIKKFDKIIVLKEQFKLGFVPESKQLAIPNPIPFLVDAQSSLHHKKAIAVGLITPRKGYERMLRSWKKVVQKHPDYQLEIYGEATGNYSIMPLISELGLENQVKVFPPVRDIEQRYLEADFLLHSAYSEPFGMVFIEAMALGLPVVCHKTEADDIVINGKNGWVAENEDDYTQKILQLIEHPELLHSFSENAVETSKRFQLKEIMHRWQALLSQRKT